MDITVCFQIPLNKLNLIPMHDVEILESFSQNMKNY